MKRQTKENVNLISLVIGVIIIIAGLGGSAITISTKSSVIIPIISLIIGSILALMGGLRKWG